VGGKSGCVVELDLDFVTGDPGFGNYPKLDPADSCT
jgi:hypothetical protein